MPLKPWNETQSGLQRKIIRINYAWESHFSALGVRWQCGRTLPNFGLARNAGANRKEPREWLANAARLIAGQKGRAGPLGYTAAQVPQGAFQPKEAFSQTKHAWFIAVSVGPRRVAENNGGCNGRPNS